MDMVIPFEVAVGVARQVALDVMTHVTICPSVMVLLVNEELFVPEFVPFTFH